LEPLQFDPIGLVTLASDFGTRDGYVGAMKGVMLSVDRRLSMYDVGHDVPAQSVVAAAMMLRTSCPYFPAGTVHLAVIDPGVGSDREEIVAVAGGQAFVGPDNGIFSLAWQALGGLDSCRTIGEHRYLLGNRSATFHGRDVFSPTAAAVAAGLLDPFAIGEDIDPMRLVLPLAMSTAGRARGQVVYCDRFGNAVTNIERPLVNEVGAPAEVRLGSGRCVALGKTYSDVESGESVALVGSSGRLEVAVRDGSAVAVLGLQPGDHIDLVGLVPTIGRPGP